MLDPEPWLLLEPEPWLPLPAWATENALAYASIATIDVIRIFNLLLLAGSIFAETSSDIKLHAEP